MATTAASIVAEFKSNGADKVAGDMRALGSATDAAGKSGSAFGNIMQTALGVFGGGLLLKGVNELKQFATAGLGAGLSFEQGMANVSAVTGATGNELKQLSDLALQIGKDTTFGANEATQAIEELAKAGVSVNDILNGAADGATALAAAGGVSLPEAASVMSAAMNQFGLSGDQATHIADLLAAAASTSATGVSELGESLKYVGTTAHAMNIPIEDIITALAILGDNGLQGSVAGTALNAALTSLINPSAKAQAKLDELGFSLLDVNGNIKSLPDIITDLNTSLSGLSDGEKLRALDQIFGTEGAKAILPLLNAQSDAAKEAGKSWADYYKAVNQDGAAAEQAAARMNSTMGAIEGLKGSLETLAIVGSMMILPMFRSLVEGASAGVDAFTSFITSIQSLIGGGNDPLTAISLAMRGFLTNLFGLDAMNAMMPFVDGILDGIQMLIDGIQAFAGVASGVLGSALGFIADHFSTIATVILPAAAAFFVAMKAISAFQAVATAVGPALAGLKAAFLGLPFPLLAAAAAIALLVAAYQTNFMGFADLVNGAVKAIVSTAKQAAAIFKSLTGVMNPVAAAFGTVGTLLSMLATRFPKLAGPIRAVAGVFNSLAGITDKAGRTFMSFLDQGLNPVAAAAGVLGVGFQKLSEIFPAFSGFFSGMRDQMTGWMGVAQSVGNGLVSLFSGDLFGALANFGEAATQMWDNAINGAQTLWTGVKELGSALGDLVSGIDWGNVASTVGNWALDGLQLAWDGLSAIDWGAILGGGIDLAGKFADWVINDIPWSDLVGGAIDLAGKFADWVINDIPWKDIASGTLDLASKFGDWVINDIPWKDLATGALDLASKFGDWVINDIPWKDLASGALDLASKFGDWVVNDIPWKDLATGALDLASKFGDWVINDIPWKDIASGTLDLAGKFTDWVVNDIPWSDLAGGAIDLKEKFTDWVVNDIPWADLAGGTLDLASKFVDWTVNDIPWAELNQGAIDLAGKFTDWVVNDIPWGDVISGTADITQKFLDWVIPPIPWSDIITGAPDIAGKFVSWTVNDIPWTSIIKGTWDAATALNAALMAPGVSLVNAIVEKLGLTTVSFDMPSKQEILDAIIAFLTPAFGGSSDPSEQRADDGTNTEQTQTDMPGSNTGSEPTGPQPTPYVPKGRATVRDVDNPLRDVRTITVNAVDNASSVIATMKAALLDIPPTKTTTLSQVGGEAVAATAAIANAAIAAIPPSSTTSITQVGAEGVAAASAIANAAISAIPTSHFTSITEAGGAAVAGAANAATAAINGIPTSHNTTLSIAGAEAVISSASAAAAAIAAIPTSVTTVVSTVQGAARAVGGYVTGGLTRLAELGPELVAMPNGNWFMAMRDALYPTPLGSYVYTASQTQGMVADLAPVPAYASGGYVGGRGSARGGVMASGGVNMHLEIHGNVIGIDDLEAKVGSAVSRSLAEETRRHLRAQGVS